MRGGSLGGVTGWACRLLNSGGGTCRDYDIPATPPPHFLSVSSAAPCKMGGVVVPSFTGEVAG